MMQQMLNIARREAQRVMMMIARPKTGIVTSYDPDNYSAKVRLQPENVETGWLPIRTPWSGKSFGMFAPPSIGDEVEIQHQEGGKQAPYIALRGFGDRFRPLAVPAGEFWLVDRLGNSFKFADGKVILNGATEIDVTTPTLNITCAAAVNVVAPVVHMSGDLAVAGNIVAGGDISDLANGAGSMQNIRAVYDVHTHPAESGNTGTPNQKL